MPDNIVELVASNERLRHLFACGELRGRIDFPANNFPTVFVACFDGRKL